MRPVDAARAGDTVAWDLDGTLVDTRHRMLATVRAYGATATLRDVAWTWEDTARALRLPRAFGAFWDAHFWDEASYVHDRPIARHALVARRAAARGVRNVAVTGRTQRAATWRQLDAFGLSFAGVACKPSIEMHTPTWKAAAVVELIEQGARVAAFVTDDAREIDAVRSVVDVACVLVERPA